MNELQFKHDYYERMAAVFDETCIHEADEHQQALAIIASVLPMLGAGSVLDVGCGTGRGIGYLRTRFPEMRCHGADASAAQLRQAMIKRGIPQDLLHECDATKLPFPDQSFDVVCEFGALHHMRNPNTAVREMTRVARRAVFISDCNRYGQGATIVRHAKWWLGNLGLWSLANFVKTFGKGYYISDEDGLAYSYSVHDSMGFVSDWADRIMIVPTAARSGTNANPWLASDHLLVGAIKGAWSKGGLG
jgi:ubiquinone/menaquinone biosynthesis C-methylase UbiE